MRYLILDSEQSVSFNSSSVLTSVSASDRKMAEVLLLDGDWEEESHDATSKRTYGADVVAGVYDKRTV